LLNLGAHATVSIAALVQVRFLQLKANCDDTLTTVQSALSRRTHG
jgi:hypothetical protein